MMYKSACSSRGNVPAVRSSVAVMSVPEELYNRTALFTWLWEGLCPDGLGLAPDFFNDVLFHHCVVFCRSPYETRCWWQDAD